jgi:Arc/MetJ family transcription regulator
MRTNIDIDDSLLKEALAVTGLKTKKAVVDEGLRRIVRGRRQLEALEALRGLGWEGQDIRSLRRNRELPQ